jgi:hypothetical protein
MPSVALVTDDPLPDGGAPGPSFTRFVLPFAYRPQPYEGPVPGTVYQATTRAHDADRRRYLTPETADTLFDRALWLELSRPATTGEHAFVGVGDASQAQPAARLVVHQATPRLVLFEWAAHANAVTAAAAQEDARSHDLLHTGFLILDVAFTGAGSVQPTLTHLQQLNEFFRWWQRPYEGYGAKGRTQFFGCAASPESHERYFDHWANLLAFPFRRPDNGELCRLFPPCWRGESLDYVQRGTADASGRDRSGWVAYPDPRAFVWTCASVKGGAMAVREAPLALDALPADWIRLLNVDPPDTSDASDFERRWASERSYGRWMHRGTLYGFCAHAGAVIAPPMSDPPVHRHFAEMYFDQTLLLLYLRVSTFRFSRALSAMSGQARNSGPRWRARLAEDFQELRASFALLTNLYRFPLLSHQQQGIELYTLARKHLDIEELFTEIQSEVRATDEFLNGATQLDHATMATMLTVVATIALALALGLDFLQVPAPDWSVAGLGARVVSTIFAAAAFLLLLVASLAFAHPLGRWLRSIAGFLRRNRERVERHASRGSHLR